MIAAIWMDPPPASDTASIISIVPTPAEVQALYPPRAAANGVEGTVLADCYVQANYSIGSCMIISEKPAGFGFGLASVKLIIRDFKLPPQNDAGAARAVNVHQKFLVSWTLK